jgi:oligopeptidase B
MLDCNELAKEKNISSWVDWVLVMTINSTYAIDLVGKNLYFRSKKFNNWRSNDKIKNTTGNSTWAGDNNTIFYTTKMQIPCVLILF